MSTNEFLPHIYVHQDETLIVLNQGPRGNKKKETAQGDHKGLAHEGRAHKGPAHKGLAHKGPAHIRAWTIRACPMRVKPIRARPTRGQGGPWRPGHKGLGTHKGNLFLFLPLQPFPLLSTNKDTTNKSLPHMYIFMHMYMYMQIYTCICKTPRASQTAQEG